MDTQNKIQVTKEGYDALQKEYDELVNVKRPAVVTRLERAREEGDLSENADYTSARDELEFLDGRIEELKLVLDHAQIAKASGKTGTVSLGTKVTVKVNESEHVFEIVGDWEADPMNKKISHESPLGQALVGKKVGEDVEVEAPAGIISYKILAIN